MAAPRDARLSGWGVGKTRQRFESVNTDATAWMRDAKCAQPGRDPDDWFPPESAPDSGVVWRQRAAATAAEHAKDLCAGCPVKPECAQYAIENSLVHGVFGGLTPNQRTRLGHRKPLP